MSLLPERSVTKRCVGIMIIDFKKYELSEFLIGFLKRSIVNNMENTRIRYYEEKYLSKKKVREEKNIKEEENRRWTINQRRKNISVVRSIIIVRQWGQGSMISEERTMRGRMPTESE